MRLRSARPLSDAALIREARELTANDRGNTAQLLVHLAEIDRRRLYLPAGYSSLYRFCIRELLMAEDVAYKRIRAARAARRHPEILSAIGDGRLNLNSIMLLAPYLKHSKAKELLAAAEGQPRSGIELLIAQHFPKPDLPTCITPPVPQSSDACTTFELAARPVFDISKHVSGFAETLAVPGEPIAPTVPSTKVAPLAPDRFGLQTTIDRETQDDLARAQELLGPGTQVRMLSSARCGCWSCSSRSRSSQLLPRPSPAAPKPEPATHSGRSEATRPGERQGSLHVRQRLRPPLRRTIRARVRSHRAGRPGRTIDCREPAAPMPRPQSAGGGPNLRSRVHGGETAVCVDVYSRNTFTSTSAMPTSAAPAIRPAQIGSWVSNQSL
jgi:hypothetical protein